MDFTGFKSDENSLNRRHFNGIAASLALLGSSTVSAQDAVSEFAPVYQPGTVRHYKIGLTLRAPTAYCANVYFTANVPANWPGEQTVKVANEQFTRHVTQYKYRDGLHGLKQMLVFIPQLPAGQSAMAHVTFEVMKNNVQKPANVAGLTITNTLPRDVRYFLGVSPLIESRNAIILKKANDITQDATSAWNRVELVYDWIRENIMYQNGNRNSALKTLQVGFGEKESLTSIFIAMCRNLKIPARTVWVPDHNYAEFYLQAPDGTGHWFPCELSGRRSFGEIADNKPILLRGDNFRVPEKQTPQRYVAEHLKASGGAKPQVQFVREYTQV